MRPIAVDLYCGLGGWTSGLLAAGYDVIGFDIERHVYGEDRYPSQLVVQDVLTLHGSQFANADLIVASPPCQEYSYMAMPWSRAKAKAAAIRADETGAELERLNRLFNACFRIQREASEAAGRHIPMVVENVRGAIPWVGRSRWNFGSYHLWGDVPALMPPVRPRAKVPGMDWNGHPAGSKPVNPDYRAVAFNGEAVRQMDESRKLPGFRFDGSGRSFQTASVEEGRKHHGDWFHDPDCPSWQGGQKAPPKGWFNDSNDPDRMALKSSKSPARKAASAKIAMIPRALSEWIGRCYLPESANGQG